MKKGLCITLYIYTVVDVCMCVLAYNISLVRTVRVVNWWRRFCACCVAAAECLVCARGVSVYASDLLLALKLAAKTHLDNTHCETADAAAPQRRYYYYIVTINHIIQLNQLPTPK